MRVLVLFDLPSTSSEDLRQYRNFRKTLIKDGFLMLQESVYTKIALNHNARDSIILNLKKNKPKKGNVIILTITEKQYSSMEYLVGQAQTGVIDSIDRMVILWN